MTRITEQPGSVLRVRTTPPLLAAMATIIAGLIGFWLIGESHIITLSRDDNGMVNGRIDSSRFGAKRSQTIEGVQEARLQQIVSRDRSGHPRDHGQGIRMQHSDDGMSVSSALTYRTVLATEEGEVPVIPSSDSRRGLHQDLTKAINGFVHNPGENRMQASIPRSPLVWLVLLLPLAGAALLLTGWGECIVDKPNHRLEINHWRPWGSRRVSMPLHQVREFQMIKISAGSLSWSYTPGIVTIEGEEIPIDENRVVTKGHGRVLPDLKKRALVERLNTFLSQTPSPQSVPPGNPESHLSAIPGFAPGPHLTGKICVICGQDCSHQARLQDAEGRYYHQQCHSRAHPAT